MPVPTTTATLNNSIPLMITSARSIREQEGDMQALVEKRTLGTGMGDTWHEVSYAQIVAMAISETTDNDNIQQISDDDFKITPTMVQIATMWTDKVTRNITRNGLREMAGLSQSAVQRKGNEDGLVTIDSASSTELGTAGGAMTFGLIAAGAANLRGNATEPARKPYFTVYHPFHGKDVADQFTAPLGTYPIGPGDTANVFKNGSFSGMLTGTAVFENGDFTIDSLDDVVAGVFAKEGIVYVQDLAPRMEVERMPRRGGGSNIVTHTASYAYGIRQNQWVHQIRADASAPTS